MRRFVPAFAVCLVSLSSLSAGCSDDPPDPSGNLRRPSGLVLAPRGDGREDMFIADSESEGVRILQTRVSGGVFSASFVESPAVYFPLAISAPGFPERMAISKGQKRLFVLSPARVDVPGRLASFGQLHVLNVEAIPFGGDSLHGSNERLGSITLAEQVEGPLVPVDVAVLGRRPEGDVVAVAFDDLNGGPGKIGLWVVTSSDAVEAVGNAELVDVAAGPRDLAIRGRESVLFVSSALTSSVSEVAFDLSGNIGSMLTGVRTLSAGGPTGGLVDAEDLGVLALRLDRSSAIVFTDPDGDGAFDRSPTFFPSPYTISEDLGTDGLRGRIDLRSAPAKAGAYGRVAQLVSPPRANVASVDLFATNGVIPELDGLAPVVFLAHLDGRASFLVGRDLKPALLAGTAVREIVRLGSPIILPECNIDPPELCGGRIAADSCLSAVVRVSVRTPTRYRAVYQGTLFVGADATFTADGIGQATISDPRVSYPVREIVEGDTAFVQVALQDACLPDRVERFADGTARVVAVREHGLDVEFDGDLRVVMSAGPSCRTARVQRYEVYAGGEEFVMTQVSGETPLRVVERVPLTEDADGVVRARFTKELAFTVSSSVGYSCVTGSTVAEESEGTFCEVDADCGAGRVCEPIPEGTTEPCRRRCSVECAPGVSGCAAKQIARVCSGAELVIAPSPAQFDLRQTSSADGSQFGSLPSAPEDVVFSSLRSAWIATYPGFRAIVRFEPTAAGFTIRFGR